MVFVVWAYCVCVYQPLVGERERMEARIDQVQTLLGKSAAGPAPATAVLREKSVRTQTSSPASPQAAGDVGKERIRTPGRQVTGNNGLEVVGVEHRRPELTATHDQAEAGFQFRGSFAGVCRLDCGS